MKRRMIVKLFPRAKYPASATGRLILAKNREHFMGLLGSAGEIWVATRAFPLTKSATAPPTPYDTTNVATLPDDGAFQVFPKMGLVDISAKAYNAKGSLEFEAWATPIVND